MNELPNVVTKNQSIAYAIVAFYTLKINPREIDEKELANEIITIMRLYKKNEIVNRAKEILANIKN